jgi:hypothetical protein
VPQPPICRYEQKTLEDGVWMIKYKSHDCFENKETKSVVFACMHFLRSGRPLHTRMCSTCTARETYSCHALHAADRTSEHLVHDTTCGGKMVWHNIGGKIVSQGGTSSGGHPVAANFGACSVLFLAGTWNVGSPTPRTASTFRPATLKTFSSDQRT